MSTTRILDPKLRPAAKAALSRFPGLKDRAVMLFRPITTRDCSVNAALEGAPLTYSMWQGYLKDEPTARVRQWLGYHAGHGFVPCGYPITIAVKT